MRVIAGTYRSRQLTAPRGARTRPTSDRLRETLFNILAPRISGARFADLYAGTGAVGIEALSRGAAHVWFAERAAPAVAVIRANLAALNIDSGFSIETRGTAALLDKLTAAEDPKLDIVFMDPPWDAEAEYSGTLASVGRSASSLLAPGALVVAEHLSKTPLADHYGQLTQIRILKQGDAALSFFSIETEI
jgi:16S rRNA (guanine(966)-N(2))-methyltransferase RsmD